MSTSEIKLPNFPTFASQTKRVEVPSQEAMTPVESAPSGTDVSALIAERGTRYGEFISHARITQAFKLTCADYLRRSSNTLSADQQEALDMIFHKIGRIVNGDPNYADSWIDIAGYAKLVSDRLEKEQKGDSALKDK